MEEFGADAENLSERDRAMAGLGPETAKREEKTETRSAEQFPSVETFSQYDIDLTETTAFLEKIADLREVKFGHVESFLGILLTDISRTEKASEKDPKWQAKKAIIQAAQAFNNDPATADYDGSIIVTASADGSLKTAWDKDAKPQEGEKAYKINPNGVFDPGGPDHDPDGLSAHLYNLAQFDILKKDALPGAMRTLAARRSVFRRPKSQDKLYATQLIERFAGDKTDAMLTVMKLKDTRREEK